MQTHIILTAHQALVCGQAVSPSHECWGRSDFLGPCFTLIKTKEICNHPLHKKAKKSKKSSAAASKRRLFISFTGIHESSKINDDG